MNFFGRVYKDGKFWIGEIPSLDAVTQGYTRKEAVYMIEDWVKTMVNEKGFHVKADLLPNNQVIVQTNSTRAVFALILQRQRQKSGLSQADAAKLLGFSSVNAYAAYEQGKREPSISKADQLLDAVSKIDKIKIAAG